MKLISTIIRHRLIISHYAELIFDYMKELQALEQTAIRFDLKRLTVKGIVNNNQKYFKIKRAEYSRCKIKIQWTQKS